MLEGTARLGIEDAKTFVGEAELTFGVAGIEDNSATVEMLESGCGCEGVEFPSSAGIPVGEPSSDALV